jgi:hypothetical protein
VLTDGQAMALRRPRICGKDRTSPHVAFDVGCAAVMSTVVLPRLMSAYVCVSGKEAGFGLYSAMTVSDPAGSPSPPPVAEIEVVLMPFLESPTRDLLPRRTFRAPKKFTVPRGVVLPLDASTVAVQVTSAGAVAGLGEQATVVEVVEIAVGGGTVTVVVPMLTAGATPVGPGVAKDRPYAA